MRRLTSNGLHRRVVYVAARARNAAANLISTGNIHGSRAEHCADFVNFVQRQGGRQDSGFPDQWRVDPQFENPDPARIGVVIHCFYSELMPELFEHLRNIPVDFDLFITNASGDKITIPEIKNLGHTVVVDVENHGRDIFPTVQIVNSGALDPYDLILKLHTKRSPWREEHTELVGNGAAWKDQFLGDLVGSTETVQDILNAFADDAALGILTATDSIVGKQFWGGDQRIADQLLRRIELSLVPDELQFASGSMYWTRGFVLQGLRALNLQAADFDEEAGQVDGTTAHAIERIIGILTNEAGLNIAEPVHVAQLKREGWRNPTAYRRFERDAQRIANAQVVPFYLPQFHDSPQNNRWWGRGFTEWSNVVAAVPAWQGHYQPKQPTELGYYDLALDSVRKEQADLAAAHGVAGFMYYYYWFSGERLLSLPIEKLKESDIAFPFCIMWANENWTRRWDGRSEDVLVGQDYSKVPAEDFIDDVMEFLLDPRYMRLDGKAVLAVYRPAQMDDFAQVVRTWRDRARRAGVGELKILAVAVAREFDGLDDFASAGLDGTLQFPPHNLPWVAGPATAVGLDSRWRGNFMSYQATANASLHAAADLMDNEYPGVMVAFDNTARRQWKADAWYGSNPYTFHRWMSGMVRSVLAREPQDRVVFINAWNEWAESAILEPTTRYGRTFLQAVRNAVWS
ncbi:MULTISPECIES: glycoside hydrolase family 99-like domain-containing protein [unclassified Actinobaculum]|uniref:glycoside hydrolase family 99-like domain-containing protein n=1 Tax=unclassified Actinobaculum TaxID=2609299 RepID=UPI000D525980|nr:MULTISPECIES: glycoside hydrolase family 99-like domain-containing protein [unclassified Actinobaculum]AWE41950.1 glycosyl transferase family 2 [Actinobaculum sp. 313]RTE50135.1 glycosyl transferase family 2 [Actinobaculum sp. 352]